MTNAIATTSRHPEKFLDDYWTDNVKIVDPTLSPRPGQPGRGLGKGSFLPTILGQMDQYGGCDEWWIKAANDGVRKARLKKGFLMLENRRIVLE